jgi:hypothetical protein
MQSVYKCLDKIIGERFADAVLTESWKKQAKKPHTIYQMFVSVLEPYGFVATWISRKVLYTSKKEGSIVKIES